jgi:uncharacterized repeat protein (TIGR01451 family)
MNGQDWTKGTLPETHELNDIQFFTDGTPLLKPDRGEHLIRRNGSWNTMDLVPGSGEVEASFIKDDTLFVFERRTFGYSLNKGQTFTTVFEFNESLIDHTAHLWKFENHFVLHHTAGASDYLSVFNQQGDRIFYNSLSLGLPAIIYNPCGEVLFIDRNTYYLWNDQNLILSTGLAEHVIPDGNDILEQNGGYFYRGGNTLYTTNGCNFDWVPLVSHGLIASMQYVWINQEEDIFLLDENADYFIEQQDGSNSWEEVIPDINYAFVHSVNESALNNQFSLTANELFRKNTNDQNWVKADSIGSSKYQIQYSPDGDLYVNRGKDILYSNDNGQSFTVIPVPVGIFTNGSYLMTVLADDMIFLLDDILGDNYYTLNNGVDWIPALSTSFGLEVPQIKLVNNNILIAEGYYDFTVTRINLGSNEVTMEDMGDFFSVNYYGITILDDGTIYFQAFDPNFANPEGLYRYRYGEELEFMGQFPQLANISVMTSSGTDLLGFGLQEYYVFNGISLETHDYVNLPASSSKRFLLSENEYLYVIIDGHRIFRSVQPLSYSRFLQGSVYHHNNLDCVLDTSESTLTNWIVKAENAEFLRIKPTDKFGHFTFSLPEGEYKVSTQPITNRWDLCDHEYMVTINESGPTVQQDFMATPVTNCAELSIDFSTPLLRRCFGNYYSIQVRNTGPQASSGTSLILELDPFFDITSATIPYTQVEPGVLKFDIGILEVNDVVTFRIFFTLSCEAELGQEHCLAGVLEDANGCGGDRNSYTECQENIGSFDPNDKRIFNGQGDEAVQVDKGEYIYYHIRFQNTGTDTAFTVEVVDPLSPRLDLSSLELLSASHPYEYSITDGPSLLVQFDNIHLPDSSTNEPASHGYFKFRVKPLPEFDYGTIIPNQAEIYFDFNEAVLTNETSLVILPYVATNETKGQLTFELYPNPVDNLLFLALPEMDRQLISSFECINHLGQTILNVRELTNNSLDVKSLIPGIYFLLLKSNGVLIGMRSFVKQ